MAQAITVFLPRGPHDLHRRRNGTDGSQRSASMPSSNVCLATWAEVLIASLLQWSSRDAHLLEHTSRQQRAGSSHSGIIARIGGKAEFCRS
jgi:hypothetical protein